VFGEWGGYIRGDNSLCFANYVAERDPSLNLYWIARKDDNLNLNLLDSRIKVLEYGSEEAESILKTAGAMFTTGSFYDLSSSPYNFYGKAISVNLHHCAPFKRGGYRESNVQKRGFIYRSFIYKFYCKLVAKVIRERYLLSISDELAKIQVEEDFCNPKRIIKAGFPRDSIFYSEKDLQKAKRVLIEKIHGDADTKIIAYMPTWRDNGDEIPDLQKIFSADFIEWLEKNNITVIHKAHVHTNFSNREKNKLIESSQVSSRIIAMNDISASALLSGSDILISDYSSCVWDYLILDRPIIHFAYDYERFKATCKELIYDLNEICAGTIVSNAEELQKAIIDGINFPDSQKELRRQRRERFMHYEGPDSCEKIFSFVQAHLKEITTA